MYQDDQLFSDKMVKNNAVHSENDLIRDSFELMRVKIYKLGVMDDLIFTGENSGDSVEFDIDEILKNVR